MTEGGAVLLVEDDPEDSELTLRTLREVLRGLRIDKAFDGFEALERLKRPGAEAGLRLVLLDLKMPRMDGFEFLRELRGLWGPDYRNVTIAILSSSDEQQDMDTARELGVRHYFRKPITQAQSAALAAAVARLLAGAHGA